MEKFLQNSLSPVTLFCAYTKSDELHYQALEKYLDSLKQEGYIASWYSRQVITGVNWTCVADPHINTATIILLLLSPNFISSDYCQGFEMQRAWERHATKEAYILPILLSSADQQETLLASSQIVPTDIQPVPCSLDQAEPFTHVLHTLRTTIASLSSIILQAPLPSPIPLWAIPYPQNDLFTGQKDVLAKISTIFVTAHTRDTSPICALCGPSGIGKTEIALEYAYHFRHRYRSIFWAHADTTTALVFAFMSFADQLHLLEKDATDKRITVQAVINWLASTSNWLLILDNVSSFQLAREFLPPVFHGHVLFTTQAHNLEKSLYSLQIEPLSPQEGGDLLLRYRDAFSLYAPLSEVTEEERNLAEEIAREAEGLPFAILQAAAYTIADAYSVKGYLNLYRRERRLQRKELDHVLADSIHPASITFSNAIERLEKYDAAAIEMLRVCAFLAPYAIPEEVLFKGVPHVGPQTQLLSKKYSALKEKVEQLCDFALIDRDPSSQSLSIHPLVQALVKDSLDSETYQYWAERAVLAINKTFPKRGAATWHKCQRWLLHALASANIIESFNIMLPEGASLLHRSGSYAYEFGLYKEAQILIRQALSIREKLLGREHPETRETQQIFNLLSQVIHQNH